MKWNKYETIVLMIYRNGIGTFNSSSSLGLVIPPCSFGVCRSGGLGQSYPIAHFALPARFTFSLWSSNSD